MAMWAVGVDVGGTKIAAGVVDAEGELQDERVLPTPVAGGPSAIVGAIDHLARDGLTAGLARYKGVRPVGLGVGTGGQVDVRTGRIVGATAVLPKWAGTDLRSILQEALGVRVWVENDAKAMARGELAVGAAKGLQTIAFLTLGTGVGGAIAVGGRVVDGALGMAGHLGHIPVMPQGRLCSCGQRGCLEAYASGPAIVAEGRRRWVEGTGGGSLDDAHAMNAGAVRSGGVEVDVPNASAVWDAYRRGEDWATPVIKEARWALAAALQGVVHTVNPEAIIVGGGLSSWGQAWCDEIEGELRSRIGEVFARGLVVRCAQAGPKAGLIGAALVAVQQAQGTP